MQGERGLTLLEVVVALMIFSLVGLSYLELFHQSHRVVGDSRQWSRATGYAEDAMERVKIEGAPTQPVVEDLPDGFKREISTRPWQPGLTAVDVTVWLPGNARFDLHRLLLKEPPIARGTSMESTDE
jgi:prepilin-type N-terminal cleavage/methylation domain-containing protein